jgi:hypothetical protein
MNKSRFWSNSGRRSQWAFSHQYRQTQEQLGKRLQGMESAWLECEALRLLVGRRRLFQRPTRRRANLCARRLQGFELIPKVVTGVRFVDGEEQSQQAA